MKRLPWIPSLAALLIVATLAPARAARTIDFDAMTIADIGRAFDSGALTSEKLARCAWRASRPPTVRVRHSTP